MAFYDYASAFGRSFFLAFATLLPILNPPACTPIFWTLTDGASHGTRIDLSRRVAINAALLMIGSLIAGNILLSFFGISLAAVRVGGGLLVIYSGWRLVNSADADTGRKAQMAEVFTPEMARARAFYPLTFPISVGPGCISAAITVGASLRSQHPSPLISAIQYAGALPGLLLVALVLFLCLRFAESLMDKLGANGTAVFMRLSAFVLLCLGVQICWDGAHDLLLDLIQDARHLPLATPSAS
ncbi:MAG TPA: MarC family protein [Bordetella sp.]